MPIKIVRPAYHIEVETEADLRLVLRALDNHQLAMPISTPVPTLSGNPFEEFWKNIKSPLGKVLLVALSAAPDGLSDEQIRALGIERDQIGGVMRGLVGAAKRADLAMSTILEKHISGKARNRTVRYQLKRPVVQVVLSAKKTLDILSEDQKAAAVAGS